MRDMLFAASWRGAFVLAATSANAQSVPGRPLLDFHVGALVEAPALATQTGGGVYNPAAILLPVTLGATGRTRTSIGRLSSRGERGLDGQIASVAHVPGTRWGVALNFTRMAVDGIERTETTPETVIGTAVYDAIVASAVGAWRVHRNVAAGVAVRHRLGRADTTRAGLTGGDLGIVADGLLGRYDLRLAASSYLWSPEAGRGDRPAFLAAADARVYGTGPTREARVGYSYEGSRGGGTETYAFASGRYRYLEARGGITRVSAFGDRVSHARFGVGLHYARFSAGVAQETGGWLGSIFQFTLSTVFR